jgi:hypothetical protein
MSPCARRSILLVCLAAALAQSATAGQNSDPNDPRFVLNEMRNRLATIWNYQCTQVNLSVGRTPHNPNQPSSVPWSKKRLAYASDGRGRLRKLYPNLDADTYIWDGRRTIHIHETTKPNGTVVYAASIAPGEHHQVAQGNTPWTYLGGTLVRVLTKALEDGTEIHIEPTEQGHCRLEIRYEYGSVMAAVLDPGRGYLPMCRETLIQGELRQHEEIKFKAIDPGVWFPTEVWIPSFPRHTSPSEQLVPRLRFTNIEINDPDFDRLLVPDLPNGSTVSDQVRDAHYVVGHNNALDLADDASSSLNTDQVEESDPNAWREAFEATYHLDPQEALKRIAPPYPAARRQFIINHEPHQAEMPEAAFLNKTYIFQCNDGLKPKVCFHGVGFLKLSHILQYACGLDICEYTGPRNTLDLRLAGDWIVRRDVSKAERLRSLEGILREETGRTITFDRQRVDAYVVRASGRFRYHRMPGALSENEVQLFVDNAGGRGMAYATGGSGTLAQLLGHLTDRTGGRFIDETESSHVNVSWSDYGSSWLADLRHDRRTHKRRLTLLLDNITQQTGLTFAVERRTIDEWLLGVKP